MKPLERLTLIERIGSELQNRMTFRDIDAYLTSHRVDCSKQTSGVNSKRIYAQELLTGEPLEIILEIATELEIPHTHVVLPSAEAVDSRFWTPGYLRLFISHLSSVKGKARALQAALRRYAVSAFVAHVDITPTKEWQREIEAALFSMDALAAILVPGFKDSDWTEQEVGVAVGRGCLVVPVMRGLAPYGLIGKYQGVQSVGKTVGAVGRMVFDALLASELTRSRALACVVDVAYRTQASAEAREKLTVLTEVAVPKPFAERLASGAAESTIIRATGDLRALVNRVLAAHKLPMLSTGRAPTPRPTEDDLPF